MVCPCTFTIGIGVGPAGSILTEALFRRCNEIHYRYIKIACAFACAYYCRTTLKVLPTPLFTQFTMLFPLGVQLITLKKTLVTENFDFPIYAGAEMGDRRNKNIKDAGSMQQNHIYQQQLQQPSSLAKLEQTQGHELKSFETTNSDTPSISMITRAKFELDTPSSSEVDGPHLRMEDLGPFQQSEYLSGLSVDTDDPPFVAPNTPLKQQDEESPSPPLNEEVPQQINPDIENADNTNSGEREKARVTESTMHKIQEIAIRNSLPLAEELLKFGYTWLKKGKIDLSGLKALLRSVVFNNLMSTAKKHLASHLGTIVEDIPDELLLELYKSWDSGGIGKIMTDVIVRIVCNKIGCYAFSQVASILLTAGLGGNPLAYFAVRAVASWLGPKLGSYLYANFICTLFSIFHLTVA